MESSVSKRSQILLGANVRHFRTFLGLTQSSLAEQCGVSVNFISEIEGGKAWVSSETLDKLAMVLGIDHYQLFLEEEDESAIADEKVETTFKDISTSLEKYMVELKQSYLAKGRRSRKKQ